MADNYEPIMLPDIEEIQAEREEKIQLAAYFSDNPMFPETVFEDRLYRKLRISPLIKCTSAIRLLAYNTVPDALDEYLQTGNATSRQCLENFCTSIVHIFGPEFLREPTLTDVERLYAFHENKHGFSGMLGSLDCTDWAWFGCPIAHKAHYCRRDHGPDPCILLEAVASNDLWIWHAFFGVYGLNNDINVTQRTPLLNEWVPFVKSITNLADDDCKRLHYKTMHEATRKDVERAFGVLKKKRAILASPARAYIKENLESIMYTCIILHNMIIKDCKEAISPKWYPKKEHQSNDIIRSDEQRYRVIRYMRSSEAHQMLKADLVEHVNRNRND
nr:hypothetical protein [Tanacetum cinerariifolium]